MDIDINSEDYRRFYIKKPDGNFSPRYNEHVVETTIKKHENNLKRKRKEMVDAIAERSDAVATYLTSLRFSESPVEQYFGKRELARLRGEKIVQHLRNGVVTFEEID